MNRILRWRLPALIVGVLGLAVSLPPALLGRAEPLEAYLVGFLYWNGLAVGALGVLAIHHLAGGRWGLLVRRPLEAAADSLPMMAILFIPLALHLSGLYPWARVGAENDEHLARIAAYLNPSFFRVRAVIYFAIWIGLAAVLRRASAAQDLQPGELIMRSLRRASAPGLILIVLTVTLSATDWTMSLDPKWYSTVYGATVLTGQGVSALAAAIVAAAALRDEEIFRRIAGPERFHDLGNLLMAFVMFWAYLAFSQFLLIWSANMSEEVTWYVQRRAAGWPAFAAALAILHFFAPFAALLSREVKRRPARIAAVAAVVLAARWMDVYWLVAPSTPARGWPPFLLDVAATAGIGGVWVWFVIGRLARRPLVPVGDPRLSDPATAASA